MELLGTTTKLLGTTVERRGTQIACLSLTLIAALMLLSAQPAEAVIFDEYGLTVQGQLDTHSIFSLSGPNSNNTSFYKVGKRAGVNFDVLRQMLRFEFTYVPSQLQTEHFGVSSFLRYRTDDDLTGLVNNTPNTNGFPLTQPSGWLMRAADKNWMTELEEGFVDFKYNTDNYGNWWLRAGKQQIIWGNVPAFRTMDTWDPIDTSQTYTLTPGNEFTDEIIIPEDAFRLTYSLPTNWLPNWLTSSAVEADLNPGDSYYTILPAAGTPFAVTPSYAIPHNQNVRGEMKYGMRYIATTRNLTQFTIGWMSEANNAGMPQGTLLHPQKVGPTTILTDLTPTNNLAFAGPFPKALCGAGTREYPTAVGCQSNTFVAHPRIWDFGASVNRFFPLLNGVLYFETLVTSDEDFGRFTEGPVYAPGYWPNHLGPLPGNSLPYQIVRRATWIGTLEYTAQFRTIPQAETPMSWTLVANNSWIVGDLTNVQGAPPPFFNPWHNRDGEAVLFALSQPLWEDALTPSISALYDIKGSYRVNPNISYQYRDRALFQTGFDVIGGHNGIYFAPITKYEGHCLWDTDVTIYF
jgi:hypothetical protein